MSYRNKKYTLLLAAALCTLLLCGCVKKVDIPSVGKLRQDTEAISAMLTAEDLPLLEQFPQLHSLNLVGSTCYEEIIAWAAAHPQVDVHYAVLLPSGVGVDNDASSLDLAQELDGDDPAGQYSQTLPLLQYLPELKQVTLGNDCPLDQALDYVSQYPEIEFRYSFSLLGQAVSTETTALDVSRAGHRDTAEILRCLPLMKNLRSVKLGSDEKSGAFEWDDIYAIHELCPKAALDYDFTLYGKSFSLLDTTMDLNHIPIGDEGELVLKVASCMSGLTLLDMDFCGVSDESMAAIRDALPNVDVVWRIWFGTGYSVRTDVEMILASNPGRGGELDYENTRSLQYCTKVKYLDLGHNSFLTSLDFVSYMPDLEVAILAMGSWWDARPLADCKKLEYLELQTSALNDLHALSKLENLRHLNICYCFALHDISPLYDLDLERLWIGRYTPIPSEQVEEIQRLHPDLEINTSTTNPTEGGWRYYSERTPWGTLEQVPRYKLLHEQFGYNETDYAYIANDPLYGPNRK